MVPNLLYATYCAGEAELRSEGELRTQSQSETLLTHERVLPTILGRLSLGSERGCYHEEVCGTTAAAAQVILILVGCVVGA
jgi:hypothetical protein